MCGLPLPVRLNPPARSLSNKLTQTKYKGYLHCIANSCMPVLNNFSKKKSFLAMPNVNTDLPTLTV